jgi:uncharacterized protein (TIGR01619 family)
MSDNWDCYFCTVDDRPASISVDLGLAGNAPVAPLFHVACVRVPMRNPREDGLSSADEARVLWQIEDALQTQGHSDDLLGLFVGRTTSAGSRDLYFYVSSPDVWISRAKQIAPRFSTYNLKIETWEDRSWKTYFDFLMPNEEQRQRIENRRVCERLEQHGDPLLQAREIDHWIYFRERRHRDEFEANALARGYQVRACSDPSERDTRYGIQIYRVDVPSYDLIDSITIPLFQLAHECDGEYDGWETAVLKAG